MPQFTDSIVGENVAVATEYFKTLAAFSKSGGSIGFIPFNINFTIDGLSGIKIYNELTLDVSFLPPGYAKTLDFIITGVDHKLKDGDWETDIKVTLIPRTSGVNTILKASAPVTKQQENYESPISTTPSTTPSTPSNTAPIAPGSAKVNKQFGGIRGDLFAWVPGPNYPDPSDPNNYNGTKYPYSKYPTFTPAKRQELLAFQSSGYLVAILKSSEDRIKNRVENWIQKPTSNPPTIKQNKGGGAVRYNTVNFTQTEQTQMYKDILARLGAPTTEYNLMWMKVWRAAEGAAATYNPWNSIQTKPNSTKYNATPGVKNYFSYKDGLDATITTLTNGNYPTILKALIKGLSSYSELQELAKLTQSWDMTGKIPSKWI